MDENEREHFKKLIDEQVKIVQEEIETLKEKCVPIAPDNAIGRLTRMEAITEKSINEANLRNAELRLQKLVIAQKRVLTDEYGECVRCGEDISNARLNVLPESTLCIECMNKLDKN